MRIHRSVAFLLSFCLLLCLLAGCGEVGDGAPEDVLNTDTDNVTDENGGDGEDGEDEGGSRPSAPEKTLPESCIGADPKGVLYVWGETDKDALSYAVGEEIVFDFRINDSKDSGASYSCPTFAWSASADDGQSLSGQADGKDGTLRLSFRMKKAGFIKVEVSVLTETGKEYTPVKRYVGGACGGFYEIGTALPEPTDFDAFWESQLAKLDGVAPELIYKNEVSSTNSAFYTYDIAIRTHDENAPATGYLTVPKNAQAGKTKLRMFFYGYNASFAPKPQYNNGYITLAINAHSIENGRENAYYSALKNGELKDYGFSASDYADPSSAYFCGMLLRNVQALRYLKTLEEWNGRDIELVGGSMGGFQATATAALEGGVSLLTVHIVWMCDVSGRAEGRLEGWLPEYADGLRYFDAVSFAARVECPTNITSAGLADYTATPCGVAAYYNALRVRKSVTFIQAADHGLSVVKKVTYTRSA